jgi:hypothetical protein
MDMEIQEVEDLLKGTQYEVFIGTFQKVVLKDFVYPTLFKIGNGKLGYFALKIGDNRDNNFKDSINCIKIVKDVESFVNINTGTIETDKYTIAVSQWLKGRQPLDLDRDKMPMFFSKLATLNKNNIVNGPYSSIYVDYKYFKTVSELIDCEIKSHEKYFFENMDRKRIMEVLENLKHGIACIINEDMNGSSVFITEDEEYKIIDTDWIIRGVNLYQFQWINYFNFSEKAWYNITEEAKDCYEAYFSTLGISNEDANEQIRAVELLSVLRENSCLKESEKDNDVEIERQIKIVLEKDKFI